MELRILKKLGIVLTLGAILIFGSLIFSQSRKNTATGRTTSRKAVRTENEAFELVKASIKKHNLANLNCILVFEDSGSEDGFFVFDIHSNNEKCGGDPNVSPRLFSYKVEKSTGKTYTDSFKWAEKKGYEYGDYHLID